MSDKEEFIRLIQQHQGIVRKISYSYADDDEDRNDLQQEILLQAWRSYARFQGKSQFATWLYRVSLNVAITSLRNRKRRPVATEFAEPPAYQHGNAAELREQIFKSLNDVEKSLAILLIEGYPQAEIAEILGVTPVNTRTKIHRLREKLSKHGIKDFLEG